MKMKKKVRNFVGHGTKFYCQWGGCLEIFNLYISIVTYDVCEFEHVRQNKCEKEVERNGGEKGKRKEGRNGLREGKVVR